MRRQRSTPLAAAALLLSLLVPAAVGAAPFPSTIALPDGFAPEGIATGRGSTFFTGSLSGAGIWRGNYLTGEGSLLLAGGGPYVGMTADARNRLWVAGGPAGTGYVFDAATGAAIETFSLATGTTFVNDVVVTGDAAYFTDSFQPVIHRVPIQPNGVIGTPSTLPLDSSAIGFVPGAFNLNGIDATPSGDTLIVVNSTAGALFTVDADTGAVAEIDLGGASVSNGDGILLHGRTLYVVRNQLNLVAVVALSPDLAGGVVADQLAVDGFDVPTTIARFGSSLYAVNARFGTPVTADTEYWVSRLDRGE